LISPYFRTDAPLNVSQLTPLVDAPPDSSCELCVIIPVRNEAALLSCTLQRLTYQQDLFARPLAHARYEIILLANNCTDDSARIARRHAREHPTLRLHVVERDFHKTRAHVGTARRMLMDEACRRLTKRGRSVIASTDGDTLVSETWIAATIAEIKIGADAVGGRILLSPQARQTLTRNAYRYHTQDEQYRLLAATLESLRDPLAHDPAPHHQHFGASFAVTAEVYRKAGGIPVVAFLEDVAFYERLRSVDARFRHSRSVQVETSARTHGRVPIGLSQQLDEWTKMNRAGASLRVESAARIERRAHLCRRLRALWLAKRSTHNEVSYEADKLACDSGVDARWLREQLSSSSAFGAFVMEFERLCEARMVETLVEVVSAIGELLERIAALRTGREAFSLPNGFSAQALEEIEPVVFSAPVYKMSQRGF